MLIIQISEPLLKNIDEEISLVIYMNMEIWIPNVGDDSFHFKCEDGQEHNEYAVAVMIGGRTGGHFPKNLNNIFNLFPALPNCAIKCNVTGNRINREARYRPEIPVQCVWTGKSCGLGRERCKKSY